MHEYRTLLSADELAFVLQRHWSAICGSACPPTTSRTPKPSPPWHRITGGNFRLVQRLFAQITRASWTIRRAGDTTQLGKSSRPPASRSSSERSDPRQIAPIFRDIKLSKSQPGWNVSAGGHPDLYAFPAARGAAWTARCRRSATRPRASSSPHALPGAWSAGTAVKYRQTLAARLAPAAAGNIAVLGTPGGAAALEAAFTASFGTLATATRARHLAALRSAIAWWARTGWVAGDPTSGWARPKITPDTTWALTGAQVGAI